MKKVCHLTTVHQRYDTRIFIKECATLVRNNYHVSLIVADGKGDEVKEGVNIYDVGLPKSRLKRVLFFPKKILKKAIRLDADIYHFHDPELLFVGRKIQRNNKKVIYDAHEDVPRQLLNKAYIPSIARKLASFFFEAFENRISSNFSGVITATPFIRQRFLKNNHMVTEVQNFPFIEEFKVDNENRDFTKVDAVCYVGSITKVRGILTIIDSFVNVKKTKLLLGGKICNKRIKVSSRVE